MENIILYIIIAVLFAIWWEVKRFNRTRAIKAHLVSEVMKMIIGKKNDGNK